MVERPDRPVDVGKRNPREENPAPEDRWERPEEATGTDEASTVHDERIVGGDEVEATRAEIEATRAEMTETIDALQQKLDPQTIKEEAKARATSTVRDTGAKATASVRQNPAIPLAVAGGIAGLLLLRSLLRGGGRSGETVVFDLKKGTTWRG